jgi:hypothetical protein
MANRYYLGSANPYRLGAGSSLLDAGEISGGPSVDILNTARPQGASSSIGAYETAADGSMNMPVFANQADTGSVWYVTISGGGNGTAWNNAYGTLQLALDAANSGDTIKMEATSGASFYPAGNVKIADSGVAYTINIQGGWQDVLTTPAQTGFSLISAISASTYGLLIGSNWPTASSHNSPKTFTVNRVNFSNVTVGIQARVGANASNSSIVANVTNSSISSNNEGIRIEYPSIFTNMGIALTTHNVSILSGLTQISGNGIHLQGNCGISPISINETSVSSFGGHGIYIQDANAQDGAGWHGGVTITITDCSIRGCYGDGIFFSETTANARGTDSITLNRVRIGACYGAGIRFSSSTGNVDPNYYVQLNATNMACVLNNGGGIILTNTKLNAIVSMLLESCTISDNNTVGASIVSSGTNTTMVIHNTIVSGSTTGAILTDSGAGAGYTHTYNDYYNNVNNLYRNANGTITYPSLTVSELTVDPVFSGMTPFNSTAYWSTTSGGISGASVPSFNDFAIFDSNSNSCTLNANITLSSSGGVKLLTGYSGIFNVASYIATITTLQLNTGTFNVGTGSLTISSATLFDIAGGWFNAKNATLVNTGTSTFSITNGIIDLPATEFRVGATSFAIEGSRIILNHNNGTFTIASGASAATVRLNFPGNTLYNLKIDSAGSNYYIHGKQQSSITSVVGSGISNGQYFTINSPTVAYYVYYTQTAGANNPNIPGKTAIECVYSTADAAITINTKTLAALVATGAFSGLVGATMSVWSNVEGLCPDTANGNLSGFTFSTTYSGASAITVNDLIISAVASGFTLLLAKILIYGNYSYNSTITSTTTATVNLATLEFKSSSSQFLLSPTPGRTILLPAAVEINKPSSSVSVSGAFPVFMGAGPNSYVKVNSGTLTAGSAAFTVSDVLIVSGGTFSADSSTQLNIGRTFASTDQFKIISGTATLVGISAASVNGYINQSGGTLIMPSGTLSSEGFTRTGGDLTHSSGTYTFKGSGFTYALTAPTEFYNVRINSSSGSFNTSNYKRIKITSNAASTFNEGAYFTFGAQEQFYVFYTKTANTNNPYLVGKIGYEVIYGAADTAANIMSKTTNNLLASVFMYAAPGTNSTTLVLPMAMTLETGQLITAYTSSLGSTIRGYVKIINGGTRFTFTTTALTGMTANDKISLNRVYLNGSTVGNNINTFSTYYHGELNSPLIDGPAPYATGFLLEDLPRSAPITIKNNLYIDSLNLLESIYFKLEGNLIETDVSYNSISSTSSYNIGVIEFTGSGTQTVSAASGSVVELPRVIVNKPTGTLVIEPSIATVNSVVSQVASAVAQSAFKWVSGSVNWNTSSFTLRGINPSLDFQGSNCQLYSLAVNNVSGTVQLKSDVIVNGPLNISSTVANYLSSVSYGPVYKIYARGDITSLAGISTTAPPRHETEIVIDGTGNQLIKADTKQNFTFSTPPGYEISEGDWFAFYDETNAGYYLYYTKTAGTNNPGVSGMTGIEVVYNDSVLTAISGTTSTTLKLSAPATFTTSQGLVAMQGPMFNYTLAAGTNNTTLVFPTTVVMATGQLLSVYYQNTGISLGTCSITTGGTGTTFTASGNSLLTGRVPGDVVRPGVRGNLQITTGGTSDTFTITGPTGLTAGDSIVVDTAAKTATITHNALMASSAYTNKFTHTYALGTVTLTPTCLYRVSSNNPRFQNPPFYGYGNANFPSTITRGFESSKANLPPLRIDKASGTATFDGYFQLSCNVLTDTTVGIYLWNHIRGTVDFGNSIFETYSFGTTTPIVKGIQRFKRLKPSVGTGSFIFEGVVETEILEIDSVYNMVGSVDVYGDVISVDRYWVTTQGTLNFKGNTNTVVERWQKITFTSAAINGKLVYFFKPGEIISEALTGATGIYVEAYGASSGGFDTYMAVKLTGTAQFSTSNPIIVGSTSGTVITATAATIASFPKECYVLKSNNAEVKLTGPYQNHPNTSSATMASSSFTVSSGILNLNGNSMSSANIALTVLIVNDGIKMQDGEVLSFTLKSLNQVTSTVYTTSTNSAINLFSQFSSWIDGSSFANIKLFEGKLHQVTAAQTIAVKSLISGTENIIGSENFVSWWDNSYSSRKRLVIKASTDALASNYVIPYVFNHAELVSSGLSLSGGNDVRLVYWDGATNTEVDRVEEQNGTSSGTWNTSSTKIWFKLRNPLGANGREYGFWLYYGNSSASTPPASLANVFSFADDFNGSSYNPTSWTAVNSGSGSITVSGGSLTVNSSAGVEWWGTSDLSPYLVNKTVISGNYVVEARLANLNITNTYPRLFGLRNSAAISGDMFCLVLNNNLTQVSSVYREVATSATALYQGDATGITYTGPETLRFIKNGTTVNAYYGSSLVNTLTKTWNLSYFAPTSSRGNTIQFDWLRVRPYVSSDVNIIVAESAHDKIEITSSISGSSFGINLYPAARNNLGNRVEIADCIPVTGKQLYIPGSNKLTGNSSSVVNKGAGNYLTF